MPTRACNRITYDLQTLIEIRDEFLAQQSALPTIPKSPSRESLEDPTIAASVNLRDKIAALNSVIYRHRCIIEYRLDERPAVRKGDIIVPIKSVRQYQVLSVHPDHVLATAIGSKKSTYIDIKYQDLSRVMI
jgi:hypothetical protein